MCSAINKSTKTRLSYSARWENGFNYLKAFVAREGHANVPTSYKEADGFQLGSWVKNLRTKKDILSAPQVARLEILPGWCWNALSILWENGFRYLQEFANQEGHVDVPVGYKTKDEYALGFWSNHQRTRKDSMLPERKARLEALPKWRWDLPQSVLWQEGFNYLTQFSNKEGHARVPMQYKSEDGFALGSWVATQRKNKDKMSPERIAKLDSLPGWSWAIHLDGWETAFLYLNEFSAREGHARIPSQYRTEDEFKLGRWVSKQRNDKGSLSPERIAKLDALPGWIWDAQAYKWETGFNHLKAFSDREGHTRVPGSYKSDDGVKLGTWVSTQRRTINSMQPERKARLEALQGWGK